VGDVNFNKNLAGLLTAFSKVAEQLQMVWVSKAMVENSREAGDLWQQINTLGLKPMIQVLTAPISNTQLQALYTEANWYIQPSWYEGFGLPVLEAMQCGTPVVSSTGGSLTEIVGDAAVTFDPKVQGALTVALEKALAMPESKRLELVAKGLHQASRFSWKQAAEETVKVYRSVVS
jgi:glycosyltransferase involved in cell wall biosynthesis